MALSGSKSVDLKGLANPFVIIAALFAFIVIFTKWGISAAVSFWFAFMGALLVWSLHQFKRARREIRSQIERCGYRVVKMNYRHFRLGPFSMWNSSRSQLVFRVVVQEPAGRERIAWARWGRRWFWNPEALELIWEV